MSEKANHIESAVGGLLAGAIFVLSPPVGVFIAGSVAGYFNAKSKRRFKTLSFLAAALATAVIGSAMFPHADGAQKVRCWPLPGGGEHPKPDSSFVC